jgi:DNA repair exonuclease SbcCD ATPase subunit
VAKWEYKTAEFKNQRDFEAQTPALGEEGWELVSEKQINGWIVASFKRSLTPEDFSGLDTVSNLISLLADPKKTEKTISNLKEAYKKHVETVKTVEDSTKEHNSLADSVKASLKFLDVKNNEVDARFADLENKKADLVTLQDVHAAELTKFEELKAALNADEKKKYAEWEAREARDYDYKTKLETALKSKEKELEKREKAVSVREAQLVAKDQEHASIKEQAESLAALVTGRRV